MSKLYMYLGHTVHSQTLNAYFPAPDMDLYIYKYIYILDVPRSPTGRCFIM